MSIINFISLLGGLALFLYGMSIMTTGLERASGGRLEKILEKMTDNVVKATIFGAVVTAAIQSSTATTVLLVGLVNAKILKLRQAIGIIMGANIGTTITAHILSLGDLGENAPFILSFLDPAALAPLGAIVGILMIMAARKSIFREIGQIFVGFSILFTGMFAMEGAVVPLRELPQFYDIFASLTNPILGVIVGAVVTIIIQSSAASIGILQALTVTGAITAANALPIIMGQNIGTCLTPVLASIGASKGAKRTAFVHVMFNTLGTVIFLIGMYGFKSVVGLSSFNDPISRSGIANFHTLFNVAGTIIFLPFTRQLEKMAYFFIKDKDDEIDDSTDVDLLDERFLGSPSYAVNQARIVVVKMAQLAFENVQRSVEMLEHYDKKKHERAQEVENVLDRMQSRVDQYLLKLTQKNELTEAESTSLSEVLQVVNEFERIGDHAENLCECSLKVYESGLSFSDQAKGELKAVTDSVCEILDLAVKGYVERDTGLVATIEPLEEVINILVETLKVRHNERLKEGLCSVDIAFPFVEALYNLERISDHCSNVGVHVISYSGSGTLDRHEYLREMHQTKTDEYKEKFDIYDKKYFDRIKG